MKPWSTWNAQKFQQTTSTFNTKNQDYNRTKSVFERRQNDKCSLAAQNRINQRLQKQCQSIDPSFNTLTISDPKKYQSKPNPKMIGLLQTERQLLNQLKASEPIKRHKQILRKLKRIYNNQEEGQTEVSTKENEQCIQEEIKRKQSIINPTSLQERQLRWEAKKRSRQSNVESLKMFQLVSSQSEQKKDLEKSKKSLIELRKRIMELKLEKSPLKMIIKKYKKLIDHYYIDFKVDLKQILDPYLESELNLNSYEDELKSLESKGSFKFDLNQNLTKFQTIQMRRRAKSSQQDYQTKLHKQIINPIIEVAIQIEQYQQINDKFKENVKKIDQEIKNNPFDCVSNSYRIKIHNTNKWL